MLLLATITVAAIAEGVTREISQIEEQIVPNGTIVVIMVEICMCEIVEQIRKMGNVQR